MHVVVVGAGLCGLTAALRLQQAGHRVTVLERSAVVGGSAQTERHGEYLVDTGPDLINSGYTRFLALAREVGLDVVTSSRRVDVIRDGRPVGFDGGRPAGLMAKPLLSVGGRARLARGHLRTRRAVKDIDPFAMTRYAEEQAQPAREFAVEAFGEEAADYLIDPIVRAFAGTGLQHTSKLAVLGALAVGTHEMRSLRGGMRALPDALAAQLDVRCGVAVTRVHETDTGVVVEFDDGDLEAGACLLAIMYDDALPLWAALEPAEFRPVPIISISLGYAARADTRSYSVLVPTREDPDALLAFVQDHKAPDRVPAGKTMITVFTEAASAMRFAKQSDDELVAWADARATRWYPELAGTRDAAVVTRWPRTGYLPGPGYWQRVAELRKALPDGRVQAAATLFGAGSMERAVLGGERAAQRMLSLCHA